MRVSFLLYIVFYGRATTIYSRDRPSLMISSRWSITVGGNFPKRLAIGKLRRVPPSGSDSTRRPAEGRKCLSFPDVWEIPGTIGGLMLG